MAKTYSLKLWIIFWVVSALFLVGFYGVLEIKNKGISSVVEMFPIDNKYKTISRFMDYLLKDNREKTFLILFENNMEIRPGGGYIGSFGIAKIKNGKVEDLQIHDLSNFDERIPDTIEPPYPIKETLHILSWKLRDSNYSPDFPTNAKKAEEFYYLGQGQEKFDGIIAITANVLISFLKVTGPIQIEGYPGTYGDENAIISLEYQVEQGYLQQGIEKGERKSVMTDLAKEIIQRISTFNASQKIQLAKIVGQDLDKKDILLFFHDADLQIEAEKANWGGAVDQTWKKDYLMLVDANMGAFKSDYYVKRSFDYTVDLSQDIPKAKLSVVYTHTAEQKDWMTKDYLTYLRAYVPEGAWLTTQKNFDDTKFGSELSKKYFGALVAVPLKTTKTVEIEYTLPKKIKENYDLKIQKQAGLNDVLVTVHVISADRTKKDYNFTLNSDIILSELK